MSARKDRDKPVTQFVESFLPEFLEDLRRHSDLIREIVRTVDDEAHKKGQAGVVALSEGVALDLQQQQELFFDVDVDFFPPSISFGSGEDKVSVTPTAGRSDNPDAAARVGIQVDFNPEGAGDDPV